jgi:hypothetical protein
VLIDGENQLEAEILFHNLSSLVWTLEKKRAANTLDAAASQFRDSFLQRLTGLAEAAYDGGRLSAASGFVTAVAGNRSRSDGDKREQKKGGLTFSDETEPSDRKSFLTSCFRPEVRRKDAGNSKANFEGLPDALTELVVKLATKSAIRVLSGSAEPDAGHHVQFLVDVFGCFASDQVAALYSLLPPNTETADHADPSVVLLQVSIFSIPQFERNVFYEYLSFKTLYKI